MSTSAPDLPVILRLHRLTMVPEDDGVMVGRPDTASYAMFPEEGAEALRMLASGMPVADMAVWFEQATGTPLDVEDFLEVLGELGFLLGEDESEEPADKPVRWQRLGKWVYSAPAWAIYAALVVGGLAAMAVHPDLRPSYRNVFFTSYVSVVPIVMLAAAMSCIFVHESAHALAGRRLGLPSTLGVGRRLYFLVFETRLDSLFSVPRRKRYLPFLAGMLSDVVLCTGLTLASLGLDRPDVPAWCHKLCLAVAFTCVLRLIWQFLFYLQTDLYYVFTNALRCTDLQNATRFRVQSRMHAILRRVGLSALSRLLTRRSQRRGQLVQEDEWSDRDRAVARWYMWLFLSGYAFSLASFAWAGIPTLWRFWSTVYDRFTSSGVAASARVDAAVFAAFSAFEFGLLAYVSVRDRRARTRSLRPQGAQS